MHAGEHDLEEYDERCGDPGPAGDGAGHGDDGAQHEQRAEVPRPTRR